MLDLSEIRPYCNDMSGVHSVSRLPQRALERRTWMERSFGRVGAALRA